MASRCIGKGKQGLTTFFACMSMPKPMSNSAFDGHRSALYQTAENVAKACMESAAAHLTGDSGPGGDGFKDIAVTVDGTWMRRGFSSMYGVAIMPKGVLLRF